MFAGRSRLVPIIFDNTNTNTRSDPRIIRDQLGSLKDLLLQSSLVIEDSKSIANMANEEDKLVWVKLVIDGHDQYAAFQVEIASKASKTNNVDHLKDAIMEKAKSRNIPSFDGGSLDVYRPGTTVFDPDGPDYLSPGLRLADLDFREITDETPLIVTAKSRQQQQPTTAVSTVYTKQAMEYSVLRLFC
jgi:hypothetical protein